MPDKKTTDYAKWLPEALEVERTDNPLTIPYDVALQEAVQLAAFINKYGCSSHPARLIARQT